MRRLEDANPDILTVPDAPKRVVHAIRRNALGVYTLCGQPGAGFTYLRVPRFDEAPAVSCRNCLRVCARDGRWL